MKSIILKNVRIWTPSGFREGNIYVESGIVKRIGESVEADSGVEVLDCKGYAVIPGLVDVHVHLREPGYSYKETIYAGSRAAAAGGFTTVCTMPNLNPVPDTKEHLERQLEIIRRDAAIEVLPFASITKNRIGDELVDYSELEAKVVGFSDDGSGVQSEDVMREAMREIAATGKVLAAHCEVNGLLKGGYIHDGEYAAIHGHRGICSESEWREVERDIMLAQQTGCRLHICHVSTKESVELVREAKRKGLPVTCETGAHYLAFTDMDLQEDGRFKMNPPLRGEADRKALLEGIADGTIDVIASDHAPHSESEKSKGLEKSAMGVTGIELSLPAVYTYAVKTGYISFDRMIEMMAIAPRKIFDIEGGSMIGERADFTIVDFDECFKVDPSEFISMGKATPFAGDTLYGRVKATIHKGEIVYRR